MTVENFRFLLYDTDFIEIDGLLYQFIDYIMYTVLFDNTYGSMYMYMCLYNIIYNLFLNVLNNESSFINILILSVARLGFFVKKKPLKHLSE